MEQESGDLISWRQNAKINEKKRRVFAPAGRVSLFFFGIFGFRANSENVGWKHWKGFQSLLLLLLLWYYLYCVVNSKACWVFCNNKQSQVFFYFCLASLTHTHTHTPDSIVSGSFVFPSGIISWRFLCHPAGCFQHLLAVGFFFLFFFGQFVGFSPTWWTTLIICT